MLVATPTRANGQLDATVLVDRLAAAERAGWQPWRFDLEQALLRVPSEIDGDALSRAGALRSPAGYRLARWLAGGGAPDPVSVRWSSGGRGSVHRFERWQLSHCVRAAGRGRSPAGRGGAQADRPGMLNWTRRTDR